MHEDPAFEIFRSASPREVLLRLADGDPLEVEARAAEYLREEGLWIDMGRMALRSLACVAYAGVDWRGDPPLATWLHARFEDAAEQLLEEELHAIASVLPPEEPTDPQLEFLSRALGMELPFARRACAALNGLPRDVRRTVWAVMMGEHSPDELDVAQQAPEGTAARHLRRAVDEIREWTRLDGWRWKAGEP